MPNGAARDIADGERQRFGQLPGDTDTDTDTGAVAAQAGGREVDRTRWRRRVGWGTPGWRDGAGTPAGCTELFSLPEGLDQAPALVAVTSGPQHVLCYVNEAYTRVFGDRARGVPVRDGMPELVENDLLPLMDRVYRGGGPGVVSARRIKYRLRESGERRHGHFTFTCAPVSSSGPGGGRQRGVLVFVLDVTDEVQAGELLRESEHRHRRAAITLQRSLLPQTLEQPDELRVAAHYLPGADAAVGGDWYDVITLGAGRSAVVIGDVMGRGVRAAAVMGQLRTAVRAYAQQDLPPHEVLRLLDGLAIQIDPAQIATCVYAVHDPSAGALTYACAGHLPPLAVDAHGLVERLDGASGPPLGTGGWPYDSATVAVKPASTVVFYTDGLVERRERDIDEGIEELAEVLRSVDGDSDDLCAQLITGMRLPAGHDDDMAVLVLRAPLWEGERTALFRSAALDLDGGVEMAGRARAFARTTLADWSLPDEVAEGALLAVGELAANALTHGVAPVALRLRRTDRRLIVEVPDGDDHLPRRRRAARTDESGRGIEVVASVASSWGARRSEHGEGKVVWCEFVLPGTEAYAARQLPAAHRSIV